MLLRLQLVVFCFCTADHIVRADIKKNYPTRRYHPTTFYSHQNKDEPDTAADEVHYAYEGGESHAGEVTSSHQENDYQESTYQIQADLTQAPGDFHLKPPQDVVYKPSALHDGYPSLDGHDFRDHELGYIYDVPHDQSHEPPGYHYLPPPAPPAHPVVETPKQTPPQMFTYYYLGRHLWYIPLYFSIYFIIYVGALVLKSIAKHKIEYPFNLQLAAEQHKTARALRNSSKKFYM